MPIAASAAEVWDAVRDVGAAHQRLVPGVLTDVVMEPGARLVTFADGLKLRELIVAIDDDRRRFAYSVVGRMQHHHASMQVVDEGPGRCRVVWITDVLPDEAAVRVGLLMDKGVAAMQAALGHR